MAKKTATKKPANSPASVGPVTGTLEGEADAPAAPAKPATKAKGNKDGIHSVLDEQFGEIEKTLLATHSGPKQPRQLRWALKSLDAAKDAAKRHVLHNA